MTVTTIAAVEAAERKEIRCSERSCSGTMPAAAQQRSAANARAGPRWIHLSLACLATFALTRLLDRFGAEAAAAAAEELERAVEGVR